MNTIALRKRTLKDTQPSQTCSEGYFFLLLLYLTVVFLCIWGVLNRLDNTNDTIEVSHHNVEARKCRDTWQCVEFRAYPYGVQVKSCSGTST